MLPREVTLEVGLPGIWVWTTRVAKVWNTHDILTGLVELFLTSCNIAVHGEYFLHRGYLISNDLNANKI